MYNGSPKNFKTGVKLEKVDVFTKECVQQFEPTHWKAVWVDRRGDQERLYNKIGPAKSQRTMLKGYGIEVQIIPCILFELTPLDLSAKEQ